MLFWSTMEWIHSNMREVLLTVLYSLCFMTAFTFISKKVSQKKRQVEQAQVESEKDTKYIRKLSRFESCMDQLHKFGGSVTSQSLVIKTKRLITPNLVKNALVYLTKKNEILRTKISRRKVRAKGKKKIEKEWCLMENADFAEFHLKLKAMTSDQWKTVFERELTKQFPEEGPLWRFIMLKEQFIPEEGMYSQSFVLSAHYLVCDAYSGFAFFKDFVEFIKAQLDDLPADEDTAHPLQSSLPELIKSLIKMSQLSILFAFAKVFMDRVVTRIKPKPICENLFTSTFTPQIINNPSMSKRTLLIPRLLNKDDTKKLIKQCKANQCTIHGALVAMAAISMATILNKGSASAPLIIPSSFNIDLRKDCNPQINSTELGCYCMDCNIEISCEDVALASNDSKFWKIAQNCDKTLQNSLQNGHHLKDLQLLEKLHINKSKNFGSLAKDNHNAGRIPQLFRITNIGKKCVVDSSTDMEIKGFYFAIAEHNVGPVFSHNIVTVNGVLYWSFVYFSNVMSEEQSVEYANLVMDKLRRC